MRSQGYVQTDAPIFTPSACEGTTTLFAVEYVDGSTVYLTQSGQLYLEATAAALGRVYCFGPAFRAERSKTRRHLTEFWMLEPEAAFATLEDMMALAEGLITHIVRSVLQRRSRELEVLQRDRSTLERIEPPSRGSPMTRRSNGCTVPATRPPGARISAAMRKRF